MYKKNFALVVAVVNVTFYRSGVYKKTEQNATRLIPYINQKMMYVVTKKLSFIVPTHKKWGRALRTPPALITKKTNFYSTNLLFLFLHN